MTSKKLCALLCITLSTIVLPSQERAEQRRQRLVARQVRQQEREEQAQLLQSQVEYRSSKRKLIAQTAEKQVLRAMVKRVPARRPRSINATQNCTICQENFRDAPGQLVQTLCKHVFHETCINSLLSHLPQGANQSQIDTQKCPNCYTVIRTLGNWDIELECRTGPFSETKFKRYKAE